MTEIIIDFVSNIPTHEGEAETIDHRPTRIDRRREGKDLARDIGGKILLSRDAEEVPLPHREMHVRVPRATVANNLAVATNRTVLADRKPFLMVGP